MTATKDISPHFKPNQIDSVILSIIIGYEGTPQAVVEFARRCDSLTDYGYWFTLSTLWVSYSGWSHLNLWKRLFASDRPNRNECIMKPSELEVFRALPDQITAFRAHRKTEHNWISYTLLPDIAARFARERRVNHYVEYVIPKSECLALFLRRGEYELMMLNPSRAKFVRKVLL